MEVVLGIPPYISRPVIKSISRGRGSITQRLKQQAGPREVEADQCPLEAASSQRKAIVRAPTWMEFHEPQILLVVMPPHQQ